MRYKPVDLLIVMALTIVAVVLAFVVPSNDVMGRVLTLPLVFGLPGYALASALFAKRTLGVPEKIAISLGLSFASVILGGLVLNWLPFGLRASSWSVLLGSITLCASSIAIIRRRGQFIPVSRRGQFISVSGGLKIRMGGLTFLHGVLLCSALAVICVAVVVSIISAQQQPYPGFTQLWMLPSGETAKNVVRIGVDNSELVPMEYILDVSVDGKVVKTWSTISLQQNDKWEVTFPLPQMSHAGPMTVEAILYRRSDPRTMYRHVMLKLGT